MSRLALLLLVASAFAPTLHARQDPKPAGSDPAAWIAQIEERLKDCRSQKEDVQAAGEAKVIEAVDQLTLNFKSYDEAQQKAIVNALAKIYAVRTDDGKDRIYNAASAALSEMGPTAEPILIKAMGIKHLEKRLEVQAFLVEALGKHKDEKQIDFFVKLLVNDEPKLVVAAIKSLSEFRDSDAKVRKRIAEQLVRSYATTHNMDNKAKGKDEVWHQRLLAIEVPMNDTLSMLTLQTNITTAPEWEKWFNDNRNKNW